MMKKIVLNSGRSGFKDIVFVGRPSKADMAEREEERQAAIARKPQSFNKYFFSSKFLILEIKNVR